MGERALQIGVDDSDLVGAIAAKVGLSGHAAVVVSEERHADKVRGAARAGALVDVQVRRSTRSHLRTTASMLSCCTRLA